MTKDEQSSFGFCGVSETEEHSDSHDAEFQPRGVPAAGLQAQGGHSRSGTLICSLTRKCQPRPLSCPICWVAPVLLSGQHPACPCHTDPEEQCQSQRKPNQEENWQHRGLWRMARSVSLGPVSGFYLVFKKWTTTEWSGMGIRESMLFRHKWFLSNAYP